MMRRAASILVLALVAAVCLVGQRAPVEAAAGACRDLSGASLAGGELEGSTPVVLVHGFTGSSMSWYGSIDRAIDDDIEISDPGSFVEKVLQIDGVSVWMFDYHDTSARWVTDPSIGPALADLLECLADNGGQPAVLAVHSMGGLAARYAMGLLDDPSVVSGLVTFGTPHFGSDVAAWMSGALDVADVASMGANPLLGSVWSFVRRDLDACAAARTGSVDDAECGWVGGVPPLGSEAGEALQRGSSAVMSLPSVPENVEVLGIAGQIDIVVQESVWGFFYSDIGRVSIGDTMVMVDSATAESDETVVRTCQLNLKTGYAISDDFRELAEINYDDGKERGISALMSNPCQHSNLMHTIEITNDALFFINDIVEDQRPFRWQGSSSELALEFVRRALAGESVLELALTFQFTDLNGSIAPSDNSWALTVPSELRDAYTAPVTLSPDEAYGDSEGPGCRFEGDLHIGCSVTISDALGKRGTIAVSMSNPGGSLGVDAYTHTPAGATVGADLPEILRNEIIDAIERNDAVSLRAFLPDDGTWESTGAIVLDLFDEPDPGPLLCFEFGAQALDCPIYAGDQPLLLMLHIVFDNREGLWIVDSAWTEDCCY